MYETEYCNVHVYKFLNPCTIVHLYRMNSGVMSFKKTNHTYIMNISNGLN